MIPNINRTDNDDIPITLIREVTLENQQ